MRFATVLVLMFGFATGSAFAGDGCIYGGSYKNTGTDTITDVPTTVELPKPAEGDAT